MTCASCAHSRASVSEGGEQAGLFCARDTNRAMKVCAEFEYEPGTDEGERHAD